MNSVQVALFLILCVLLFISFKKIILGGGGTVNIFYYLLLLMAIPGLFIDLQKIYFWGEIQYNNLLLFITLLLFTTVPWLVFDTWFKRLPSFCLTDRGVEWFKKIFRIVIISCIVSNIYVAPYAIKSFAIGAIDIRNNLTDISVLPNTIFTTFSVAVGTLSPFYVFFFFISLLDSRLKKYTLGLFLSSFTYIIVSMPFMARDGYVLLPIFYILFYKIFSKSLASQAVKKVRRYITTVGIVALWMIAVYSLSRFYIETGDGFDHHRLIGGTWGYLFQQPYVFDRTIEYQEFWHGVHLRFPILSFLSDPPVVELERTQDFETMFGTMLSEFYSIGGYWSLFVFTLSYIFFYYIGMKVNILSKNILSVFMFLTTYLLLQISGVFYFRYGGLSNNFLFLFLSIIPIFLPKGILIISDNKI